MSFRAKSRLQRSPENCQGEARLSLPSYHFTVAPRDPSTPLCSAQDDSPLTLQPFNYSTHHESHPFVHLFRERTLRAIGIVLHTEIFVDLQQSLLMCHGAQKLFPARVISKETCRSGLEAAI